MIMKILSYFKLKGMNKELNKLVQKEKINYLKYRVLKLFRINYPNYYLGLGLKKPVIVDTSSGLFYCRENSLDLHIVSASYEFKVKQLFEKLSRESKVIIDIGANIGKYTLLGSLKNPNAKVYAIEPEKNNFKILSENIKLNNLNNVVLIKIALGNKKGRAKLYEGENNKNFGRYSLRNNTNNFEVVQQNTFDNIFKNKTNKIDLIKIDVEGWELEVLKGMGFFLQNHKIKNIILEIDKDNYFNVKNLFEKHNYTIKHIMYNNYLATEN